MHLNTDQLVDLAEGTQPEASAPHLAACASCRAQVRELRAMMSATQELDVPEPSPLFWDHLSSNVRDAVAADARLKPSRYIFRGVRAFFGARAFQASVLVAAGVLLAVALNLRAPSPAPIAAPPALVAADAGAPIELLGDVSPDEDASLTLVATLMDDADPDAVREAGLEPRGSAEHAVTHMSDGELRELGRLLKEELARPGA